MILREIRGSAIWAWPAQTLCCYQVRLVQMALLQSSRSAMARFRLPVIETDYDRLLLTSIHFGKLDAGSCTIVSIRRDFGMVSSVPIGPESERSIGTHSWNSALPPTFPGLNRRSPSQNSIPNCFATGVPSPHKANDKSIGAGLFCLNHLSSVICNFRQVLAVTQCCHKFAHRYQARNRDNCPGCSAS